MPVNDKCQQLQQYFIRNKAWKAVWNSGCSFSVLTRTQFIRFNLTIFPMQKFFNLFFLLLIILISRLEAQPYSAFVNMKGELWAFNGKNIQQLDYLQPIAYRTGGNCIAFIDNTKSFKVFWNGEVHKLNDGYTTDFETTRNLLLIRNSATLYVFDNGKLSLLTVYSSNNVAGDSLVGFLDDKNYAYKLYANGRTVTLEENTVEFPLKQFSISSNTFAWVNPYNEFKIWYRGAVIEQESNIPEKFYTGKNIVSYIDSYGSFRVFYKGETLDIESFAPKKILTGDDLCAYIDNLGELKIFYDGKVFDTNVLNPEVLSVSHNLVAFDNGSGGYTVFYKGKITRLENNFIPTDVQMGDNTLFYFDQANQVKIFSFGRVEQPINQLYESALIDFDVVQLKIGFNQYRFYYNGKLY